MVAPIETDEMAVLKTEMELMKQKMIEEKVQMEALKNVFVK